MRSGKRSDRIADERGCMIAAFAVRPQAGNPVWSEYLVTVQTLGNAFDVVRHGRGNTHEIHVFALSPEVPVSFDRSIFEQNKLRPLTPSGIGFQFQAESDQSAFELADRISDGILEGRLNPDGAGPEWTMVIPADAARLRKPAVLEACA